MTHELARPDERLDLDTAFSDDAWREDYEDLAVIRELTPTIVTSVGEHVWRGLSDDERAALRGIQARHVEIAYTDEVRRQAEAILSDLSPDERAAMSAFVVGAIDHTYQHIEFAHRSVEELENFSETFEQQAEV